MKLVIDISEKDFALIRGVNNPNLLLLAESRTMLAVKNGTPLASVLDEIREEIVETRSKQNVGVLECLDIIDKYSAESENYNCVACAHDGDSNICNECENGSKYLKWRTV